MLVQKSKVRKPHRINPRGLSRYNGPWWKVPQIWEGERCYILGGGPSLADVDVERLRGQHVIAVNNAFKLGDWIEFMFYGNCAFGIWHGAALSQFPGHKLTTCIYNEQLEFKPLVIRYSKKFGLSIKPNLLHWNRSSGACAVNLATLLGATEIVLLGYDMRRINGQNNWHNEHPVTEENNADPYESFLEPWPDIALGAKMIGATIINATPNSDLIQFPIVEPEEIMP